MAFTEEYVRAFLNEAAALHRGGTSNRFSFDIPFERLTYDQAFERFAGQRVLSCSVEELAGLAQKCGVAIPPDLKADDAHRDEWLNLLLAELVEPQFGVERPTFLYDYPASQAALARIRHETPPVAERFELYIGGIELCNGYHELLDAAELRGRNREQNAKRAALGLRTLPEDSRLLAAMEHGLPSCSGVALGFDRLLMIALGLGSVAAARAFPTEGLP
jgi:lysyl-tRNA synthetase class 2